MYMFNPDSYTPGPNECLSPGYLEYMSQSWNKTQRKNDSIYAENQAAKFFTKTLHLKAMTDNLITNGVSPLPVTDEVKEVTLLRYNKRSDYCLLTVNPKPEVTLEEFKKSIQKMLKKKTIPVYFQVYEVRKGESGLHSHILLRYTCSSHSFMRSTKSTFKNICDVNNSAILNFKFIAPELLQDKLSYLLGVKQTKKLKGVDDTKAYRKKYNLLDFHESSPPFPCRATQTPLLVD